jgi:UDP-N-acetylmuramate--alanine ligase
MNINKINKVFFLGIGGIGMSALARYFISKACQVSGYDRTPSPITDSLQQEGAAIFFSDEPSLISEELMNSPTSLFIYTPAIPTENLILQSLQQAKKHLYKRSEILGALSKDYNTIGIAGTHGKTTVSSMTAHILNESQQGCQAFLGGIALNYKSNMISHSQSHWMVVEADEYDHSFLQLFPSLALITSMDADHLDIYGNHENLIQAFQKYASQIKPDGRLIVKHSLAHYFSQNENLFTYDIQNSAAHFYAEDIRMINHQYHFNFIYPQGKIENIILQMPGMVNLENAVASAGAAKLSGTNDHEIKNALQSFLGIKRRMELILDNEKITFYDDYAHHPKEIEASINSLKALYPNRELTVLFQPHLFSRTLDFAQDFALSLGKADHLILLEIYPAREKPIEGVSSKIILNNVLLKNKVLLTKESLRPYLMQQQPELLLSLGAGDIDRLVEPIKRDFI